MIGQLYTVERFIPGPDKIAPAITLQLRVELRHERSRELIDKIRKWAEAQVALPQSGLGKAIAYMFGLWPGLIRFLDDPCVPPDNNTVERALRGVVVGRKNHYGSRSRRGTQVAALLYSLCETAKLVGVEPRDYLTRATHAAIDRPGSVTLPESPRDPQAQPPTTSSGT